MHKTHMEVSNSQDVMDSRDVIARIEELEGFRDDAKDEAERIIAARGVAERDSTEQEDIYGEETASDGTKYYTSVDFGEDEYSELKVLQALADEADGSPDWKYGETLIRDSYFTEYAEQLADDIGAIKSDASWPNNCIDWEKAAELLQQDYFTVDFDGVQYWIRC